MESPNLQMSESPGSYNLFGSEDPKQAPEEQKASKEEEEDCPFFEEEDKEPSEESSEEPEKTQSPLDDDTNYLDQLEFFTLLQDFGIDFPESDRTMHINNPKKSKAKHIRYGPHLYHGIWKLARKLLDDILKKNQSSIV